MVDLSGYHRELGVPLTRLHDVVWVNYDAVDISTIFRDFRNDPARPESYEFAATDDYIAAIVNTGSPILYRLGESIEHTPRQYRVHPPPDFAQVGGDLLRHHRPLQRGLGWRLPAQHPVLGNLERTGEPARHVDGHGRSVFPALRSHGSGHQDALAGPESRRPFAGIHGGIQRWSVPGGRLFAAFPALLSGTPSAVGFLFLAPVCPGPVRLRPPRARYPAVARRARVHEDREPSQRVELPAQRRLAPDDQGRPGPAARAVECPEWAAPRARLSRRGR